MLSQIISLCNFSIYIIAIYVIVNLCNSLCNFSVYVIASTVVVFKAFFKVTIQKDSILCMYPQIKN